MNREGNKSDFGLIYKKNLKSKLTIVITKKIVPKAVSRNRIRRLIKEVLRKINLKGDLKIIVKQDLSGLKLQDVKKNLEPQIKKLI